MIINSIVHSVSDLVIHQLKAYWTEIDVFSIRKAVPTALQMMDTNFKDINSSRFQVDGDARFNPLMSVHWMIFLYRLSSILFKNGGGYCSKSGLLPKQDHAFNRLVLCDRITCSFSVRASTW